MKDAPKRTQRTNGARQDLRGYLRGADDNEERGLGATWAMVDSSQLAAVVNLVTDGGRGITLGRTSDGGALSVAILATGEQPDKYYFTDPGQFAAFASRIQDWYTAGLG